MAQLIGHHPVNQKVEGSIPSQGTCPGCQFSPQSGRVQKGNQSMFLFLSFPLPSPVSEIDGHILGQGLKQKEKKE